MPLIRRLIVILLISSGSALAEEVPLGTMPFWTTSEQNIYSTGMIWRDCNRDGIIDVFFSNGNDIVQAANNIYLFGTGPPPTSASWYSSNLEYSGHCAVGDINDDGFPDLVVSNYIGIGFGYPSQGELYLNQGGLPAAAPVWQTPDPMFTFSCALGDVDNDGDLDLAFATGEGYQADYQPDLIYLNEGGSFSGTAYWSSANSTAALDVAWGDVDNDGDLDLAFTYDRIAAAVYYNDAGTLETSPSWQAGTAESGNTLLFGDVNGDDWLDLVVAYNSQLNGQGRFRVYFNDGIGNLDPVYGWQSAAGGYGSAIALGDYDSDGDDDLAAGRWFSELWVYENLGATFTTAPVWTTDISCVAEELAWVDIDGGGVLPIADTLEIDGDTRLFYTRHHPLYEIDSVLVDGVPLGYSDYCYDLVSGWLSLAESPNSEAVCYYRYSYHNDLAVSNWDTVNMVFANTNPPFVDIAAEDAFGPVPLEVRFSDNSVGAFDWSWDFGDGESSSLQNPQHLYEQPGQYDVTVEITTPERTYSSIYGAMVSAYADTMKMGQGKLVGRRARVDVYLHNHLPLSAMVIPFSWAGPFDLRFDSMSTNGLRTAYFDTAAVVSLVINWDAATMRLASGSQSPLDPGEGPIVSLYFTDLGVGATGSNPVVCWNYVGRELTLVTDAGEYVPETTDGAVYIECCQGRVGDANGIGGDEPSLGDVAIMIDMLFISGAETNCLAETDINQSGSVLPTADDITIGDISTLIDYLFITGPLLGLPDCL